MPTWIGFALRLSIASAALASCLLLHAPARAEAPVESAGVVNLNTAEEAELMRLPGVGPSKARAIVEQRTRQQGFKRVEDLLRVKGIGRKTFRKLLPMLALSGPTTLLERPKKPRDGLALELEGDAVRDHDRGDVAD